MRPFKKFFALILVCALLCALPGCQRLPKKADTTIFAMDTVMDLQIYNMTEGDARALLDRCVKEIYALDRQLSAENPDSFVCALNHAGGEWAEVPDSATLALFMDTLALCEKTGGALDVTAYPATLAWGFTSGDYRVPDTAELEELAGRIDYGAVETSNWEGPSRRGGVRLPEGMALDLGAVAKGYAADRLWELLKEESIDGALLDLGQSTILALHSNWQRDRMGSPWRIGVRDPAGEGYVGVLEVTDRIIATSGGYQRYFEENGQTYWHILDPDTAAPARSGLTSVTVVGTDGLTCDGLSTALFVMGLEEGTRFWRDHPELGVEVVFISEDGSIAVTKGLGESFTLARGYEDREVTVLQ